MFEECLHVVDEGLIEKLMVWAMWTKGKLRSVKYLTNSQFHTANAFVTREIEGCADPCRDSSSLAVPRLVY